MRISAVRAKCHPNRPHCAKGLCSACYAKRWKKSSPAAYAASVASQRKNAANAREFLRRFKNKPCLDCKCKFPPYVMDFDHVRGKKKFVIARSYQRSREILLKEIAKCDLVCSNCHRIRTHKRKIQRNIKRNIGTT